ncbi:MAG: 6,7-dimethyl-8-ribityllumazine synthase [Bacteroidota bacterium]
MPTVIEGNLSAQRYRLGIVVSRFNGEVTARLLQGALDCLREHGASDKKIDVFYCAGSYEIPQVARRVAGTKHYQALICLGCVIRGETPHFEYVAGEAARGISNAALATGIPMSFGVLTTDTVDQAMERSGGSLGNKGWNAALSAIEMATLWSRIQGK